MTETPIEKLQRILREKAPDPSAPIQIAERRELMEKTSFKVKQDIDVETVQVAGLQAEWLRAPAAQTDRAILYLHGGGLVVATLVAARDQGLSMPRAAVCISPWGDMTCSNESFRTRDHADPMVKHASITQMADLYLNGADPKEPLASPNFADLTGLPPMLIHVGSDETLVDDAIALDRKAKADGVQSTLEVWDKMVHVWHAFHPMLPEGQDGIERVGEFLCQQWAA
ncbi:hypothetical protein C2W62_41340 [Candidatus Entotheonella serta]|nr:hypothetical protein C2W62_41340 [Candidatus Entotheonella serta]